MGEHIQPMVAMFLTAAVPSFATNQNHLEKKLVTFVGSWSGDKNGVSYG